MDDFTQPPRPRQARPSAKELADSPKGAHHGHMKWHLSASLEKTPIDESMWQRAGPPTSLNEAKKGRNDQFSLVLLITERTLEFERVSQRALERFLHYQIFHLRRL